MEVWDVKKYKLISKPVASDSTYFAWCPDGEHIFIGLQAPSLRANNGYTLWYYASLILATVFGWTISSENNCFPSSFK